MGACLNPANETSAPDHHAREGGGMWAEKAVIPQVISPADTPLLLHITKGCRMAMADSFDPGAMIT
jgi:hypothetical protein